jgi:hypothetical protein
MQRPWDKTALGTKQSLRTALSQNILGKFAPKVPIFRDGLSVPENKTGPDPVARPQQGGPDDSAPAVRPWRRDSGDPGLTARVQQPCLGGPAPADKFYTYEYFKTMLRSCIVLMQLRLSLWNGKMMWLWLRPLPYGQWWASLHDFITALQIGRYQFCLKR